MNRVMRNKILVSHIIEEGIAKNQKDLGAKMGYTSDSAFSQVINEKVQEPKDFITKLKRFVPNLNEEWLLNGEGEMLKVPAATMSPFPYNDTVAIRSQRSIIEDAEVVGEQSPTQPRSDTRPLTAEECELCPARLPYVKGELVQARDVDIRKLVESAPHKLEHRSLRDMIGNPDYVQKVITEAMMPTFQPGDLLFIQFLPDNAKLISGAIYLIDTRLYGAMVRQVFVEQDYYILHSKNPEYKELKLKKADVYSFSLVLHSLRSDFKISTTSPDGAEVFKKREKQLERLLSMHEEALAEIRIQNERMAEERKRQDEERKAERDRLDKLIDRIMK